MGIEPNIMVPGNDKSLSIEGDTYSSNYTVLSEMSVSVELSKDNTFGT